jgi:transcriptional regulator with XRE-family HTH domain
VVDCHQRLAALRLLAGLPAREAAKRLGLKLNHYLALERGQEELNPPLVDSIAALYDIPPQSVCAGPLPIPRSYGYPFDVEDEITETLLTLYEVYAVIDRWRQALGDEWPEYRKRLEAITGLSLATPYPNPVIHLPSRIPVVVRFDLPHAVKGWNMPIRITVRQGDRVMERAGNPFEVGPGTVEFWSPRAIKLRLRPKAM